MASGTRLRRSGQRQAAPVRSRQAPTFDFGLEAPVPGEKKLNLEQVYALEHLFQSSPAVQSARTVLAGQLLGGGISLKKDGKDVELKPAFRDHLNDVWVAFAGDVLDSFLKWGFAVVCYDDHEDEFRQAGLLSKRRRVDQQGSRAQSAQNKEESRTPPQIVPMVPVLGTYEVAYAQGGRAGYRREYYVYSQAPSTATVRDDEARVIVRQHPDQVGNVSSPLASVFDLGSFVGSLTELALTAEASRARPRLVTQIRHKEQNALSADALFFDADSRAVQASSDNNENQAAARALALQQALCQTINRFQTRKEPEIQTGSFSGAPSKGPAAPQEMAPSIFCVPKVSLVFSLSTQPLVQHTLVALCGNAPIPRLWPIRLAGAGARPKRVQSRVARRPGGAFSPRDGAVLRGPRRAGGPGVLRPLRGQVLLPVRRYRATRATVQPTPHASRCNVFACTDSAY